MTRSLLVALLLAATLAGCSEDPFEKYCDTVTDQRDALSKVLDAGGPGAFIDALPYFRTLRDAAPADISDEWQQIVVSIEGLQDALEEAGADPATYDRNDPPEGTSSEDRDRIDAAAKRLNDTETRAAFSAVEQQARDVCRTPLIIG